MSPMQPTRYEHELDELKEQVTALRKSLRGVESAPNCWCPYRAAGEPHTPECKQASAALSASPEGER